MNIHGVNTIEPNADVERARVALYSENDDDLIHTTPSEDEFKNYGSNADVMVTLARSNIKRLIAEKVDRNYPKRTQAEVRNQIEETLVDMHQLESSATLKRN